MKRPSNIFEKKTRLKTLLTSRIFLTFGPLAVLQVLLTTAAKVFWSSNAGTTAVLILVGVDLAVAPLALGIYRLLVDLKQGRHFFLRSIVVIELALLTAFAVALFTSFALSGQFDNVFAKSSDPETNIIRESILYGHITTSLFVGVVGQLFLSAAWLDQVLKKRKERQRLQQ